MKREIKQSIIIRTDLKMGKGKIASQAAHASVLGFILMLKKDKAILKDWLAQGMPKIVLKVNSLEELLEIEKKAKEKKIISAKITDAGKTQIEPNTITALVLGPAPQEHIDSITKNLKLL
ncbi:MAG: peptidyl-tRNA hydrolase Pth2 [Candidatus Anstonellaceae archaeon]